MQKIQDTIIGASGIGLVEAVPNLVPGSIDNASGIVQTIIQILIGIVTLAGLFKKRRNQ